MKNIKETKTVLLSHFVWSKSPLFGFSQIFWLVKSTNRQYLGLEAKNDKNKGTLFSRTLKESGLTFIIFGLKAETLTIFAFEQSMSLEKILSKEILWFLKLALLFLE